MWNKRILPSFAEAHLSQIGTPDEKYMAGLFDAAKVTCVDCADNLELFTDDGKEYFHKTGNKSKRYCRAWRIRQLIDWRLQRARQELADDTIRARLVGLRNLRPAAFADLLQHVATGGQMQQENINILNYFRYNLLEPDGLKNGTVRKEVIEFIRRDAGALEVKQ